jgi:glycosyltransferase involved in cell wall biosynthesis
MSGADGIDSRLRILFMGKRYYTNRDAYKERYGRIYQLPYWWAAAGHEVHLWLVDYHGRECGSARDKELTVETTPVFRGRFVARLLKLCLGRFRANKPNIIVASGDCYIGMLAWVAARLSGACLVFDIYDRYDVFDGYRRWLGFDPLTFLLRHSDVVMFASVAVRDDLGPTARKTALVPNGVDLERFRPLPGGESRKHFGLPDSVPLVGYFGSMEPERGVEDLVSAVAMLVGDGIEVNLVIGGKAEPGIDLEHPWLHYLGNVEFSSMPAALASCDVLALPYRQGAFVDNAASCKIAEYIAAQRPVVGTRSPNLTRNFPEQAEQLADLLAAPGDVADLARCLMAQLEQRRLADMPAGMSWQEISMRALGEIDTACTPRAAK